MASANYIPPTTPTDTFRDSVATINKEGKRQWIYPKKPKGPLYNLRTYLSWVYLAVFFSLPFIEVDGHPLFLANVLERKFILFGVVFWPQDFFIFMLGMVTFVVFVVLFTVIFGRAFCGWACPQTVFLEMVFRKIEYLIEGDANAQRALNQAPWTTSKIRKRMLKHSIYFTVSYIISNTFLMYILGYQQVFDFYNDPIANAKTFVGLTLFTFVFYGVFSWFREQVCIIVCPYGRLQGVLLDSKSVLVAYDYKRGEPRGHIKKNEVAPVAKGDCIDCALCVKVCPTGIDIRNGTQLECVNCTACIDACDTVMESIGKPKKLIKYASEDGIAKGEKLRFTPRMRAYSVVLVGLIGVLVYLLVSRDTVQANILRTPGRLYTEHPNGEVSNLYNLKLLNKSFDVHNAELKAEGLKTLRVEVIGGKGIELPKAGMAERMVMLYINKSELHTIKTKLILGLYVDGKKIETLKTNFMAPADVR